MKKLVICCAFMVSFNIISCKKQDIKENNNVDYSIIHSNSLISAIQQGDIDYVSKYINQNSDDEEYREEYKYFSKDELRILRNTIYAMHGYKFKSKDLQEYFGKFSWYQGTKENVDSELNENELFHINNILAKEAAFPPPPRQADIEDIIGTWLFPVSASVEAIGFFELEIFPDGTFSFNKQNYSWTLEGNTFRTYDKEEPDSNKIIFPMPPPMRLGEVQNFSVSFIEFNGKTYKSCNFLIGNAGDDDYEEPMDFYQIEMYYDGYWGDDA